MKDLKNQRTRLLRMIFLSMMVAIGVVISPILRVEGMCPMAHFINITCSVFLGPWYSLLCAVLIGIIRMNFMGIPPLALTGAVFGAFLSGWLYKMSRGRMIYAVVGEVIGTGIIGAIVSYPVMAGLMGRTGLTWMFYVPGFICATLVGGSLAFIFLKALNRAKILTKMQIALGSKTIEQEENAKTESIGIAAIGLVVLIGAFALTKGVMKLSGPLSLGIPFAAFLLVEIIAAVYFTYNLKNNFGKVSDAK